MRLSGAKYTPPVKKNWIVCLIKKFKKQSLDNYIEQELKNNMKFSGSFLTQELYNNVVKQRAIIEYYNRPITWYERVLRPRTQVIQFYRNMVYKLQIIFYNFNLSFWINDNIIHRKDKYYVPRINKFFINAWLLDIPVLSERVQLAAINQNTFNIQYIQNPTDKVQDIIVDTQDYNLIKMIKNPNEKVMKYIADAEKDELVSGLAESINDAEKPEVVKNMSDELVSGLVESIDDMNKNYKIRYDDRIQK